MEGSVVGGDDLVGEGVVGGVDGLAGGVGAEPVEGTAKAEVEGDGGPVGGDEAFDFGVIEDDGVGFVAEEAGGAFGVEVGDEVGGDVDEVVGRAEEVGEGGEDWFQVRTSSVVMWKAWPIVWGLPRRPMRPWAKSAAWVTCQRVLPSPGMMTGCPLRSRQAVVQEWAELW